MDDTKKTTPKLNPDIREKATELFNLIEKQWTKDGETTQTSENMMKEMGDLLKSHQGMKELYYAYLASLNTSQTATYDLEDATWHMNNKALSDLNELARNTIEIIEVINNERPATHLEHRVNCAGRLAKNLYYLTNIEFVHRAESYHKEIKELKEVL